MANKEKPLAKQLHKNKNLCFGKMGGQKAPLLAKRCNNTPELKRAPLCRFGPHISCDTFNTFGATK